MLNELDLATMQADLAGLAGDAEQAITYRVYTSTTAGNATLGIPATDNYDDQATTATTRELTVEEIQLSNGAYQVGDREFGVRRATVSNRDLIVYGGATWEIREIRPVALGGTTLKYGLRCKKV